MSIIVKEFRGQGYLPAELPAKYRHSIVAGSYEGNHEMLESFVIPEIGDDTVYGKVLDVNYVEGDPANPGILTVVFECEEA